MPVSTTKLLRSGASWGERIRIIRLPARMFWIGSKKMTQAGIALLPKEVLEMWKEGGLLT